MVCLKFCRELGFEDFEKPLEEFLDGNNIVMTMLML